MDCSTIYNKGEKKIFFWGFCPQVYLYKYTVHFWRFNCIIESVIFIIVHIFYSAGGTNLVYQTPFFFNFIFLIDSNIYTDYKPYSEVITIWSIFYYLKRNILRQIFKSKESSFSLAYFNFYSVWTYKLGRATRSLC